MITSTRTLFTEVEEALLLTGVFRGGVHQGAVPSKLETYPDGTVKEYVAIWPRVPSPIDDSPVSDMPLLDGKSYQFQTTLVSDDVLFLGDMVDATDAALTGLVIGGGYLRRNPGAEPEGFLLDDTLTPTRYWAPMVWQIRVQ